MHEYSGSGNYTPPGRIRKILVGAAILGLTATAGLALVALITKYPVACFWAAIAALLLLFAYAVGDAAIG